MSVPRVPWPTTVFVPQNSDLLIYCTVNNATPSWSVDVIGDTLMTALPLSDRRQLLSTYGVYPIENTDMPGNIQGLLINETSRNNQTKVICAGSVSFFETSILVYGKS